MQWILVLMLLFAAVGQATDLTGSLMLPNGTGVTGTLFMSLSQQAALKGGGSCGGPAIVLPTYRVRIAVTNGALPTGPAPYVFGNDCVLPNGTWYEVSFQDAQGNVLLKDRWIINGASVDIGTIQSAVIAGTTQTLGGTGVVISEPAGEQLITQPGVTYFKPNRMDVTEQIDFLSQTTGYCDVNGCTFAKALNANGGLTTHPSSNTDLHIGANGNFYIRMFTGADAPCTTSLLDGWMGMRLDTKELQVCYNSQVWKLQLTL